MLCLSQQQLLQQQPPPQQLSQQASVIMPLSMSSLLNALNVNSRI